MSILRLLGEVFSLKSFVQVPFAATVVLFISGFTLLALQIVGVRVLGPFLGTAIPVWGAVIGTILVGSFLGYYAGGAIADFSEHRAIPFLISIAGGVSLMLIPSLRELVAHISAEMSGLLPICVSAMLLYLLPATSLCAITTYIIRRFVRDVHTIAQVHGDLYAIATIGSIAGVFVTSYYLIPHFTLTATLYGLGCLTLLGGIISLTLFRNKRV